MIFKSSVSIFAQVCIILCFLVFQCVAEHAPEKQPEIKRDSKWCDNGVATRTTGECICSSHLGFYCKENGEATQRVDGKACQSGYGISFFHWTCMECSCVHEKIPAGEWKERKNALKQGIRKQQKFSE